MTRFEKWAIWVTTLLTTATGLVFAWMRYLLEPAAPWDVVNHRLQPLVLKLHILVAPLMVFAIGIVTLRHVWPHFASGIKSGRWSGIGTAFALAPMVVSGYLIQVVTLESWLLGLALAHLAIGIVYTVVLGVHQFVLKPKAAAAETSGSPEASRPVEVSSGKES